jgi:hypothetical protein
MVLNQNQINELLRIVEVTHTVFIAQNIGIDTLSEEDILLLRRFNIDPSDYAVEHTPYKIAYLFGKLSQILGDKNTKSLKYDDLVKYVRNRQYEPLTDTEKEIYKIAQRRTYSHLKNLEERVKQTVAGEVLEYSHKNREQFEKVTKEAIKSAVRKRESIGYVISQLGNKTEDWRRDLGRIAATEMQNIFELGRAEQIAKNSKKGWDTEVYKDVFPGACRHCIRLYMTTGIGSKPRIFKLKDLVANGTNIGRKVENWVPTVTALHPWCRCLLTEVPRFREWNDKEKKWTMVERDYSKKFGIKITVGDKVFNI